MGLKLGLDPVQSSQSGAGYELPGTEVEIVAPKDVAKEMRLQKGIDRGTEVGVLLARDRTRKAKLNLRPQLRAVRADREGMWIGTNLVLDASL